MQQLLLLLLLLLLLFLLLLPELGLQLKPRCLGLGMLSQLTLLHFQSKCRWVAAFELLQSQLIFDA